MFAKSDSIANLAAALSAAQGEIRGAVADSENPHYRSKYADLSSVWDAIRGPLSKNGLAIIQLPSSGDDGKVVVTTMLSHKSGEWIATTACATPPPRASGMGDAQAIGSAISYLRRYLLSAMVGVAQVDDDGEAATAAPKDAVVDLAQARRTKQRAAAARAEREGAATSQGTDAGPGPATGPGPDAGQSQDAAKEPSQSHKLTLSALWGRAQRLGKDEKYWKEMLATAGVTRDRSTHTPAALSILSDLLDQVEGINKDVE